MAKEIRELAFAGYDRVSGAALAQNRGERFANEAGVLDAMQCVIANDDAARRSDSLRQDIQSEGVPFYGAPSELARDAIAEYLVWKFFPSQANVHCIKVGMKDFVIDVLARAEATDDDVLIARMIFDSKYDWRGFAVELATKQDTSHA
jgi:hypothetical protein